MTSSLNWQEAGTSERKGIFGLLAVAAFALVFVLTVAVTHMRVRAPIASQLADDEQYVLSRWA